MPDGIANPATDVLELLSSGASYDEILEEHLYVKREDILAAIEYAAHQADHAVLLAA
jgi:uncharacterized protein (DUF433 family)